MGSGRAGTFLLSLLHSGQPRRPPPAARRPPPAARRPPPRGDQVRVELSDEEVGELVRQANGVRQLVRIKIADDNDLDQVGSQRLLRRRPCLI